MSYSNLLNALIETGLQYRRFLIIDTKFIQKSSCTSMFDPRMTNKWLSEHVKHGQNRNTYVEFSCIKCSCFDYFDRLTR